MGITSGPSAASPFMLGQIAVQRGFIEPPELDECLVMQKRYASENRPILLGELLLARGHLDRRALDDLLLAQKVMRAGADSGRSDLGLGMEDVTVIDPNIAEAHVRDMGNAAMERIEAKEQPEPGDEDQTIVMRDPGMGASPVTRDANTSPAPTRGERLADTTKRLGEYALEKHLSKGSMGSVFLARKDGDDRWVALKVLDPLQGADDELVVRFRREAEFLMSLDHPNIVAAFEVGAAGDQHYLSMEYVQGENLGTRVEREGPTDPVTALRIMRQTSEALLYAEERGIVHRDVKPDNVLIRQDGVVKLADLGLAILANREDLRLTAPGALVGTPNYMSPEQARSQRDIDIRSDIYSLGCTFYFALCGRPPFDGQAIVVCKKHINEEPPRPMSLRQGLRVEVENVIMKCMRKDREKRFQDLSSLITKIDDVLTRIAPPPKPKGIETQFSFTDFPKKPNQN